MHGQENIGTKADMALPNYQLQYCDIIVMLFIKWHEMLKLIWITKNKIQQINYIVNTKIWDMSYVKIIQSVELPCNN